jgi:hypothetical protein
MFGFTDVVNVRKKITVEVWQVHHMCMLVYIISRTTNPHYLYRAYYEFCCRVESISAISSEIQCQKIY